MIAATNKTICRTLGAPHVARALCILLFVGLVAVGATPSTEGSGPMVGGRTEVTFDPTNEMHVEALAAVTAAVENKKGCRADLRVLKMTQQVVAGIVFNMSEIRDETNSQLWEAEVWRRAGPYGYSVENFNRIGERRPDNCASPTSEQS